MNLAQLWKIKMRKAGHQLAMLQTNNAIWDLVAVVADLPTMITIQWVNGSSRNKNLGVIHSPSNKFAVRQEGISKRDIVNLKYYK